MSLLVSSFFFDMEARIAVSLDNSLVAATYLLIRNYSHKKEKWKKRGRGIGRLIRLMT